MPDLTCDVIGHFVNASLEHLWVWSYFFSSKSTFGTRICVAYLLHISKGFHDGVTRQYFFFFFSKWTSFWSFGELKFNIRFYFIYFLVKFIRTRKKLIFFFLNFLILCTYIIIIWIHFTLCLDLIVMLLEYYLMCYLSLIKLFWSFVFYFVWAKLTRFCP